MMFKFFLCHTHKIILKQRLQSETQRERDMKWNLKTAMLGLAFLAIVPSCASTSEPNSVALCELREAGYQVKATDQGKASWYSIKTNYGTKTASGQRLCNNAPTAAHKTLPMGTKVRVTNLANEKSEIVTINDRGPFIKGRVIDVTIGTAEKLGFVQRGIVPVKVEVLAKIDDGKDKDKD
jgi:rare lipoprotein A